MELSSKMMTYSLENRELSQGKGKGTLNNPLQGTRTRDNTRDACSNALCSQRSRHKNTGMFLEYHSWRRSALASNKRNDIEQSEPLYPVIINVIPLFAERPF